MTFIHGRAEEAGDISGKSIMLRESLITSFMGKEIFRISMIKMHPSGFRQSSLMVGVSIRTLPDGRVSDAPSLTVGFLTAPSRVFAYDALAASRITRSKVPGATFRKRLLPLRETAMLMVGLLPVKLKPPS